MSEVFTDEIPKWIKKDEKETYDEDFIKILDFFLIHSPVPGLSVRCKTLDNYGWEKPWRKPFWLNKQLKKASLDYRLLFSSSSRDRLYENLEKANMLNDFPAQIEKERICVVDNKHNQFMSVFYHIRNAFAHGRFHISYVQGKRIYILEDVTPGKSPKAVTGRMIIYQDTLLEWIDIIVGGQKEYVS